MATITCEGITLKIDCSNGKLQIELINNENEGNEVELLVPEGTEEDEEEQQGHLKKNFRLP